MLLILDNRDSFVFNLDQAFRAAGMSTEVVRTDRVSAAEALDRPLDGLVLSPGPGRPVESSCLLEVVKRAPADLPILGVCLGCQALAEADGARLARLAQVYHGRCSEIRHDGRGILAGVPDPFSACRYHSLVIEHDSLPDAWEATAWAEGNTVMGIRHRARPRFGVQFHPESFRTPEGGRVLSNFCAVVRARVPS